jgi:hypothetical protein
MASARAVETLRQAWLVYRGVIAAHERVAILLVLLGDDEGACAERLAAEWERDRLARLKTRLDELEVVDRPA